MLTLRILNGNPDRLRSRLGDLATGLTLKAGDAVIECVTEEQVACGRAVFEALIKGGHMAIQVDETSGKTIGRLSEFDPEAGLIVLYGLVAGG